MWNSCSKIFKWWFSGWQHSLLCNALCSLLWCVCFSLHLSCACTLTKWQNFAKRIFFTARSLEFKGLFFKDLWSSSRNSKGFSSIEGIKKENGKKTFSKVSSFYLVNLFVCLLVYCVGKTTFSVQSFAQQCQRLSAIHESAS